jgi:hypothetical protein
MALVEDGLGQPGGPVELAVNTESGSEIYEFAGIFCGHAGRSFAALIVLPGAGRRNLAQAGAGRRRPAQAGAGRRRPAQSSANRCSSCSRSVTARVGGQGVKRELTVVSLAQQHAQRSVAFPALKGWSRESPAQQRQRPVKLGLIVAAADLIQLGLDPIAIDPACEQPRPDPIFAPALELTLVGDEQAREPLVIQIPELGEDPDRVLVSTPLRSSWRCISLTVRSRAFSNR